MRRSVIDDLSLISLEQYTFLFMNLFNWCCASVGRVVCLISGKLLFSGLLFT